jgi:hypothetical protein
MVVEIQTALFAKGEALGQIALRDSVGPREWACTHKVAERPCGVNIKPGSLSQVQAAVEILDATGQIEIHHYATGVPPQTTSSGPKT